jgi:hypothetical protein
MNKDRAPSVKWVHTGQQGSIFDKDIDFFHSHVQTSSGAHAADYPVGNEG